MAKFALTDASVVINSVDLSDHISSCSLSVNQRELNTEAMGDTWESVIAGLKSWSLNIDFQQDFAASEVDATIWPIIGTVVAVVVKPTSGSVSSTNPSFSGNVLIGGDYSPVGGSHGDLATTSVGWKGSGALTRATS